MKSTLSRFISSSVTCRPTSGLNWSSAKTISAGNPPILPPIIDNASSAESFMCLPMTPAGPLSVVTKPILTLSAARAGATRNSSAAAALRCFFMFTPQSAARDCSVPRLLAMTPLVVVAGAVKQSPAGDGRRCASARQLHIFEIAGQAVDAGARRRDPRGEAAGLGHRPHQAFDEQIVLGRWQ